ncbi:MAG: glycosyltransferase [Chloroflexi bacterium]|nr:glycosyltransferase [Chloroflexota bacterium]
MRAAAGKHHRRVAYLMSRFPKISETFILYEIVALEELGFRIEIFPLVREREPVQHHEAERLAAGAHDVSLFSRAVLRAQLHWLRRSPRRYLAAWGSALRGNFRSPRFLVRALAVVPLAATFARRMDASAVEHIHAHWATHPALAAYIASRLTGIPYSFTAHAHDIYVERPMLEEKIRRAAFVVTISDFNRRFLEKLYGRLAAQRVVVVHCGTDTSLFHPPPSRASGPWTIVCIASLQPQKGQSFLIEACRRLVVEGVDLRCIFIGDGETRPLLKAQIRDAGLEDRLELIGSQPRHRVVELLGAAHVVAQPSIVLPNGKMEGIPVALMEALAMERPVVASAISGISELVEDGVTGILVPPQDSARLADALRRLYRQPELGARLGRAGRQRVVNDFDLTRSARALAALFGMQGVS